MYTTKANAFIIAKTYFAIDKFVSVAANLAALLPSTSEVDSISKAGLDY
jgi:hypothetical protein